MNELCLNLRTVTPLLINGADDRLQLRAPSFRGVFRYWMRALLGAKHLGSTDKLYEKESQYWGNTSVGSFINLRVDGDLRRSPRDKVVLPTHLSLANFPAQQDFSLILSIHPLRDPSTIFTSQLYSSLLLASILGGFGKRARRGGGHIQITGIAPNWSCEHASTYNNLVELLQTEEPAAAISEALNYINPDKPPVTSNIPDYPIFDRQHCVVIVGENGFDNHVDALDKVWQLVKKYAHIKTEIEMYNKRTRSLDGMHIVDRWWAWGYTRTNLHHKDADFNNKDKQLVPDGNVSPYRAYGERRASAVHITAHSYRNQYYPLITIFRSKPDHDKHHPKEKSSWELFNDLASDLLTANFKEVYGDRSGWV